MQMEGALQGRLNTARLLWSERISCKGQIEDSISPLAPRIEHVGLAAVLWTRQRFQFLQCR